MESARIIGNGWRGLILRSFGRSAAMISDIQRERAEARRRKLEQRRIEAREKSRNRRYLRLERVKCGKKGCKKCASGELHGPYWYLYRPKENGAGPHERVRRQETAPNARQRVRRRRRTAVGDLIIFLCIASRVIMDNRT